DSFEVLLKLEYLTFSFTPFLFVLFMKSLLKFQVNRILFLIALFYPIPISVIILFTGSYFFSGYLLEAIMSIFFCIIFVGYEIINKWKHEDRDCRYTIRTLSLVFFMFSLAILNDILISFGFYQWYELTGFGLILFIFGQAVIIAKNNSNAWRNTDKLNLDIIKLNSELDSKIEERTDELQKTVHSRMKDLSLAKEIQNNLLPSNQIFDKRVSIFSYYQAMDEVGGDIYDINQLGENTMRIFLADATGHGVQAGLITMLIKAEYDNLKIYSDNPNFILEELNRRYISKYKYLNRYFTCAILDINFDKKNIKFASAGHPSQLFFNSKNTEELHYTGPLMGFLPNAKFDLITKGMDSGSFFLLFSDGLFEQFNERNEILGEEKITDFFDGIVKGLSRFEDLPDFIANWIKNQKIRDDICFLGIKYLD
ncbi:MAG: SpoIIE family protein phosphatase, partial [Leptospira sp.]|nr:SpoIIE family protein phosphatase [Leptospira sp.]